jgi:hypothetical protein
VFFVRLRSVRIVNLYDSGSVYIGPWTQLSTKVDTCKYKRNLKTNERFTRTIRKTHDTRNERTIHKLTNHWSVTIYYPMTNDPGSIEVQYSIVLYYLNDFCAKFGAYCKLI